ncbi:MmgE/PrpD family protein [Bradyrhizobium sp. 143]|uniref:MmgE/PrpD family protein n=1 Tax=Bradyrhizobium sp. 143 TaxID=2782619 RepID=UPI001FF91219|nr:MmgE/PrpD family protein [Bradyrhizobium sp. 143]MCK1709589.1 MmgE/PrpD family protein [Bradyrhizobium sp. 143]
MQTGTSDLTTSFAEVLQGVATAQMTPEVSRASKQRILDFLSVTFNGLNEPASGVAFRSIGPSSGPCTVIGRDVTAAAADAAFVNAVTSHTTCQEDVGGGAHPGVYVVPVALAIGEQHRCSGEEVLRAVVVGYEAAQRMTMAAGTGLGKAGFRTLSTVGVFGAAASAAVLSRLDTDKFAAALNFAANMAGGLLQSLGAGGMEVYLQAGLAARAGINAIAFAGAGGEAAPGTLDGQYGFLNAFMRGRHDAGDLIADTAELGILRARSKPFPACLVNQDTMLLIRSLQPGGLAPSQIERVTVTRPATGQNGYDGPGIMADPPYRTMIQAAMSAKFTSISALLGKPVTELRHIRESFGDRDVEQVANKTSLLAAERDADGITVEVVLKDGRIITMRSTDVPDMSWDTDMEARFKRLASPRLHGAARTVCDVVAGLESAPDIGRLMQLVRAQAVDAGTSPDCNG